MCYIANSDSFPVDINRTRQGVIPRSWTGVLNNQDLNGHGCFELFERIE